MRHRGLLHSVSFLVKAPLILLFLLVINAMTYHGEWWVKWPALGLGIAWIFSLFRVLRAALVVGGLAGLAALFSRANR
jgi:hypothetical protein